MQKAPLRSINTRRGAFYTIDHTHSHEGETVFLPEDIAFSNHAQHGCALWRTPVIVTNLCYFVKSIMMSLERVTNLVIASGDSGAFWSFAKS